jgi:hypothetical protein
MARFAVLMSLVTLLAITLPTHNLPVSNPQALSLVAQSIATDLRKPVVDLSLTRNVTWFREIPA